MSYAPSLHVGADLSPIGVMNGRISPHPVLLPMGEGTLEFPLRIVQASLLPWGEGPDEGRTPRSWQNRATAGAYVSDKAARPGFSSRVIAP